MQIQFSTSVDYVPAWNKNRDLPADQQIKAKLTILEMGELLSLMDAFASTGLSGKVDTDDINPGSTQQIVKEFSNLLPKHGSLSGLFKQDGSAIPIDDIIKYPAFMNLAMELLMQLTTISAPSEADTKN